MLSLPTSTRLKLGSEAVIELTGLRNPCHQIDGFQSGLLKHCKTVTPQCVVRKAGVMSIVLQGGIVRPGDVIGVELPAEPHVALVYRVTDMGEA